MSRRSRILVVDDKPNYLALFRRIIGDGLDLVTASDATEALACLARQRVDVIVSDVKMPGTDGIDLLRRARVLYPDIQVILMTAYGTVPDAVAALKSGAFHYLTKPFDPDDALDLIKDALARRPPSEQASALGRPRLIAASSAMEQVVTLVARAATSEVPVLIVGESGTGRELVARELHRRSIRSGGPFISISCGALAHPLGEVELFGAVRGTRAAVSSPMARQGLVSEASGGTLFLDNLAELPAPLQTRLLRALELRSIRRVGGLVDERVDVRFVAATSSDVNGVTEEGKLRDDFFHRLSVFSIHLPPLRERREEIEALAMEFLERARVLRGASCTAFTDEARSALVAYDWPGNVRQLENAVLSAATATANAEIRLEDLPEELRREAATGRPPVDLSKLSYREVLAHSRDRALKEYLIALMKDVRGNVTQAAERAGVERESLHRLLRKYDLRADDFRVR